MAQKVLKLNLTEAQHDLVKAGNVQVILTPPVAKMSFFEKELYDTEIKLQGLKVMVADSEAKLKEYDTEHKNIEQAKLFFMRELSEISKQQCGRRMENFFESKKINPHVQAERKFYSDRKLELINYTDYKDFLENYLKSPNLNNLY